VLTFEDWLALCELNEDEVLAIAEHEHLPEVIAVELGNYLVHSPEGVPMIRAMIVDDMAAAKARGDLKHFRKLLLVLRHFCETHPNGQA
jgi:hypothetical protein